MSIIPTAIPTSTSTTPKAPTATLPSGSAVTTNPNSAAGTSAMNSVNSNTFLQLLVAQMQYQDPNNPVNSTQFLSQTASFEEVQELGTLQTAVTNMVTAQQNSAATSMLGQKVQATDSTGQPISGVVTGWQMTSNGPLLQIGNQTASLSSVTAVGTAASASTAGAGSQAPGTSSTTTSSPATSSTTGSSTTTSSPTTSSTTSSSNSTSTQAGSTANTTSQASA